MKDTPIIPIEESVGFTLAQLCKAHRNYMDAALSALGVHVGQEMILMQLWQAEGVTQTQLVGNLCVEPPTVTKMVQRMERDGLIERRADPEDARVSRVYLTDRGRALRSAVEAAWKTAEVQMIAGFSAEERILARRLLIQMRRNLMDS
jgi:DNA-binding MarR family transcriptional regulator